MIPSFQLQTCNDTLIHKDILEKFNMPITSSVNSDENIQLSDQVTDFENDQLLMHQIEFSDSENAISHDCNSMELETNDEMINTREESGNVINYTFIGNGLILIEGSQVDFDDETKDSTNDLGLLNGLSSLFITFLLHINFCFSKRIIQL